MLPVRLAQAVGRAFGSVAFALAGKERQKALASLQTAFPERTAAERLQLARGCFRHWGSFAFELACIRQIDARIDHWVAWAEADRAVLANAMARGKGVLLVTAHLGNWELLARRITLAGFPGNTIARETTDPRLTRMIGRFRASAKLRTLWRGQPGASVAIVRAIKAGELLGVLIDQDTRVPSVFVPFFGTLAATPRAVADLALRTGAAVVVAFCPRSADGRYVLTCEEAVVPATDSEAEVVALTAALTQRIEQAIRRTPEQWVWMHRRWKTRP